LMVKHRFDSSNSRYAARFINPRRTDCTNAQTTGR